MKAVGHGRSFLLAIPLLALVIATIVSLYRPTPTGQTIPQSSEVPVTVAARNLPKGTTIRDDDLQSILIPRTRADGILGVVLSKSPVLGLTTFFPLQKGQLLRASDLTSPPRYSEVSFPRRPRLLDSPLDWPLPSRADETRASTQRR